MRVSTEGEPAGDAYRLCVFLGGGGGELPVPRDAGALGTLEPGDEIAFEEGESGYTIRKSEPTTAEGDDPFEKYRASAESDETMPDRMRRLRGEFPRDIAENGDASEEKP